MNSGIIMPPEKKVVDIKGSNVPSNTENPQEGFREAPKGPDLSKMNIVQTMRQIAQDIETGTIPAPEYIVMVAGMEKEQVHTYVLGNKLSKTQLVGVLTTVSNRASLSQ